MVSTDNNVKGTYNELEFHDDFSTDVHPIYSKMPRFTVRGGSSARTYRLPAIVLGVLCAVFLFIVIGLGVHLTWVSDKHDLLSVNTSRISAQLTQLQSEHKSLTESKNTLQNKNMKDMKQITALQSELSTQTQLNNNLQRQNHKLQEDNSKLMTQLTNLEGNCGKCLPNWVLMNNTCYFFAVSGTHSQRGWDGGREDCKKRAADLVTIDSKEEQEFITNTLKHRYNLEFSYQNGFWIGLKDDHTEGVWKWLNQTTLTQGYWMDGEPNDQWSTEDCAALYPSNNPLKAWNDAPCLHPLKWICEKEIDKTP